MSLAKIRPRRGTCTEWRLTNPILQEGELGIEFPDTGIGSGLCKFKMGDGSKHWEDLSYAFDATSAQSFHGGNSEVYNQFEVRCDTTAKWKEIDPVINQGEIVYDITMQAIKVGNGILKFSELPYIGVEYQEVMTWDFGDLEVDEGRTGPGDAVTDFGDLSDYIYSDNIVNPEDEWAVPIP